MARSKKVTAKSLTVDILAEITRLENDTSGTVEQIQIDELYAVVNERKRSKR